MTTPNTYVCPCCSGTIAGPLPIDGLAHLKLTPMELKIVRLMIKRFPSKLSGDFLLDYIYRDDPEGGPDNANISLHVTLSNIRRKLEKAGWKIASDRGGGPNNYSEYKLEPLQQAA